MKYTFRSRFVVFRYALQWCHNERDSVSNHQPHDCLLKRLFRRRASRENIKAPRYWPLWGEFTGDRWIPPQRASKAENVSIWWRHNGVDFKAMSVMVTSPAMIPLAPYQSSTPENERTKLMMKARQTKHKNPPAYLMWYNVHCLILYM